MTTTLYLPASTGSNSSGWTHATGVRFTVTDTFNELGSYHTDSSQQSKVALYKLTTGTYDSGIATKQAEASFSSGTAGWQFQSVSTQNLDSSEQYWMLRISDGDNEKALISSSTTGIQSGAIASYITWSTGFPANVNTGTGGSTVYDYSTKFCQALQESSSPSPTAGPRLPPPPIIMERF